MTAGAPSTAPVTAEPIGAPLFRFPCDCEIDANGPMPVLRHAPACAAGAMLLRAATTAFAALDQDKPDEARAILDDALSRVP